MYIYLYINIHGNERQIQYFQDLGPTLACHKLLLTVTTFHLRGFHDLNMMCSTFAQNLYTTLHWNQLYNV